MKGHSQVFYSFVLSSVIFVCRLCHNSKHLFRHLQWPPLPAPYLPHHLHIVTCRGDYYTGYGLDNWIYQHLVHTTTINYGVVTGLHTLQISKSSQSSLVVSWQRSNYTSLTVTAARMKSTLRNLIVFLPIFLNHLRLPAQETPSILSHPSQSHIATDGQSVSQSVLVSSPIWGS
jgi:hypothetical protein